MGSIGGDRSRWMRRVVEEEMGRVGGGGKKIGGGDR